MYRVADSRSMPVGVFDSLDEAKAIVPEVTRWEQVGESQWNGWRPDGPYGGRPDYTIHAAATEPSRNPDCTCWAPDDAEPEDREEET